MTAAIGNERRPLQGIGVVVTRPAHQSEHLCALIESAGGTAIRFPVLAIADPEDARALNQLIDRLDEYQLAIFISPNAVERAMNLIRARREFPPALRIAAVGKGSARELARLGRQCDLVPEHKFDSETLLALDELQHVAGQRIVIFRGEGGRELLADTLRARGAVVEYAEVYRRVRATPDTSELLKRWGRGEVQVVIVTSNEALHYLYDLVGKLGREWLRRTTLVVVSARMLQLARDLGIEADVLVAEQPSDEALVDAVIRWRTGPGETPE